MGNRPLIQHTVCIDLPGEPVECWAETDVTVLLRKHRDVIFDVHLSKGKTYTVEAADDWIYDTRKKQRVKSATFQDGERLHIWIGRDFKGFLLLRVGTTELQRYSMLLLNTDNHGEDPKTKPEPIILTYGAQAGISASPQLALFSSGGKPTAGQPGLASRFMEPSWQMGLTPYPTATTFFDDPFSCKKLVPVKLPPATHPAPEQIGHVFEVDVTTIPSDLVKALETGGADETAIDTQKVATRNWIIGQFIGTAGYFGDNLPWVSELWKSNFRLLRIVHKRAGPKWYVVFKGSLKSREEITAAKYSVKNSKIFAITGGAGSAESMAQSAWKSAKGAVTTKAGVITIVLTIGLDFAEWYNDYKQVDNAGHHKKDWFDLFAKVGIDLAVAGLTAALTSLIVGGLATASIAAGLATFPVVATVAIAIGVAVGVGYVVNLIDKKVHFTDWVASKLREAAALYEKNMPTDYNPYSPMFGGMP
ncbi:hypothetical protein [Paraburkholderia sp. GAS32]|uniref:hypothetical protein n=1 Tax=Paraburkholderia sp. GAS32 TaxID=3035129 RepID=UPI003D1E68CF